MLVAADAVLVVVPAVAAAVAECIGEDASVGAV